MPNKTYTDMALNSNRVNLHAILHADVTLYLTADHLLMKLRKCFCIKKYVIAIKLSELPLVYRNCEGYIFHIALKQ